MKKCTKCGKNKKLDQFYQSLAAKDGHRACCIQCYNAIYKKKYVSKTQNPLYKKELFTLIKHHRTTPVNFFGFFVGVLVYIADREILAYSNLEKSQVFRTAGEAKLFLYGQVIRAGEKISQGLSDQARKVARKIK